MAWHAGLGCTMSGRWYGRRVDERPGRDRARAVPARRPAGRRPGAVEGEAGRPQADLLGRALPRRREGVLQAVRHRPRVRLLPGGPADRGGAGLGRHRDGRHRPHGRALQHRGRRRARVDRGRQGARVARLQPHRAARAQGPVRQRRAHDARAEGPQDRRHPDRLHVPLQRGPLPREGGHGAGRRRAGAAAGAARAQRRAGRQAHRRRRHRRAVRLPPGGRRGRGDDHADRATPSRGRSPP